MKLNNGAHNSDGTVAVAAVSDGGEGGDDDGEDNGNKDDSNNSYTCDSHLLMTSG